MAYIRTKKQRGNLYGYLVHGVREGSKVRQKVLAYLGPFWCAELTAEALADIAGRHPDIELDADKLRADLIAKQKKASGSGQSHEQSRQQEKEYVDEVREKFGERWRKQFMDGFKEGIDSEIAEAIVQKGFRGLAREYHPDAGGDEDKMKRLTATARKLMVLVGVGPED